ncbi:MAG: hypothetical protein CMC15_18685 [Flavobacteriaceae bacterium]|nr:hypothetical protein [Flavobacteriaceae bacterium]
MIGLHRSDGSERQKNDFYATGCEAVHPLMEFLNWEDGGKLIWENSCGQGHLSLPLQAYGHKVISTDLIDRGFGIGGVDFLKPSPFDHMPYDAIIMNPPYKNKKPQKFVEKALTISNLVCAFLRIQFLESTGRIEFYKKTPPKYVLIFSWRCRSSKNAKFHKDEKSTQCYAWFIWEKGYSGDPIIKFIT